MVNVNHFRSSSDARSSLLQMGYFQGGLTIVDIYSEWAGPCTAMSGALKKIKLEVGDDSLVYAMAKSDTIPQLKKFRGHCKPTYLFMASGHLCESI